MRQARHEVSHTTASRLEAQTLVLHLRKEDCSMRCRLRHASLWNEFQGMWLRGQGPGHCGLKPVAV